MNLSYAGTLGTRKRFPQLELAAYGNVKIQSFMRVEKNGVLSRWPLVELSAYESVLLEELLLYLQNTEITTTELHDG